MEPNTYAKRTIPPQEQEVIDALGKSKQQYGDLSAYVTTTQDLELITWNGNLPSIDNMSRQVTPSGTTLKIVMLSKFMDFGLTDDLNATHQYKVRIPCDSVTISDIRRTVEPSSYHGKLQALVEHQEPVAQMQ